MSSLSAFLHKQRTRWYRRGIDRSHGLRRHLAYYVTEHGFEIGDYSGGEPTIRLYNKSKLKVGKYSSIATGAVFIMGGLHRTDAVTTSLLEIPHGLGPAVPDIVIGSDVWIAGQAVILSGVTIGDGAVIGAGSIVIDDVPPYAVVFGNPARLIRKRFADDIVDELLRLRWWDFGDEQVQSLRTLLLGDDVARAIDELRKLRGMPSWNRKAVEPFPKSAPAADKADGGNHPTEAEISAWCIDYLAKVLKVAPSGIDPATRLTRLGIDSATSIILVVDLEEWLGLELEPNVIFEQPTIVELARYLAGKCADQPSVRRTG